ncbi:MAG: hypothetical protein V4772_09145 [Pseudomonadota bacterium]
MKRFFAVIATVLACVFLFGCAHPISMSPDVTTVAAASGNKVIDKKVAYYLPDALRAVEVTTPGGGGDKVRYFPYRDIETGFYKALSEVFGSVNKVPDAKDTAALKSGGFSFLITPEITTSSSSESAFTWPPTQFSVNLACSITDPDGKLVDTVRVSGNGAATFDEFKTNHSLAATRAASDALVKLVKALNESPNLRK